MNKDEKGGFIEMMNAKKGLTKEKGHGNRESIVRCEGNGAIPRFRDD